MSADKLVSRFQHVIQPVFQYVSHSESLSFQSVSRPVTYFQRISKSVIQFFNILVTPSQQVVSIRPM